jgi:RNA polymerase sigma-70 factor (ECF subfamily)
MEFDRLVEANKDAVYRQMVRMCGNREDAEDVLVDALLNAYRAMDQLDDPAAFRGWLAIIARRTCGRLKRREAAREALTPVLRLADLADQGIEPASGERPPDEQAMEAETRACIESVIASLPPLYREVYDLRDVQELTAPEVARQLGISVAAVKSRLHRARALVRERVDAGLGCAAV